MFPIFHAAIPLLIAEIPYIKDKVNWNRFLLLLGGLLADLVDKPLRFLGIGNGRFIAHTLLFLFIATILIYGLIRLSQGFNNLKGLTISFIVGGSLHLILDLPDIPLFYPFIYYDFPVEEGILLIWFIDYFTDPVSLITEVSGLAILISILYTHKLYSVSKIWNFLVSNQYDMNYTK